MSGKWTGRGPALREVLSKSLAATDASCILHTCSLPRFLSLPTRLLEDLVVSTTPSPSLFGLEFLTAFSTYLGALATALTQEAKDDAILSEGRTAF